MFRIGLGRDNILLAMMLIAAAWRRPRELPYRIAETFGFSEDFVRPALETAEATLARTDALGETTFTGGIMLTALAVVLAIGVGTAFLRYFGFALWREGTAYRSRGGLLTKKEVVVETTKIQQLTLSQDLLLRWFKRFRLRVHPAADADTSEHHDVPQVLEVPLLEAPLAQEMRASVFGEEDDGLVLLPKSDEFRRVSPHFMQALLLRLGVVPAVAGAALLMPVTGLTKVWAAFAGTWGGDMDRLRGTHRSAALAPTRLRVREGRHGEPQRVRGTQGRRVSLPQGPECRVEAVAPRAAGRARDPRSRVGERYGDGSVHRTRRGASVA